MDGRPSKTSRREQLLLARPPRTRPTTSLARRQDVRLPPTRGRATRAFGQRAKADEYEGLRLPRRLSGGRQTRTGSSRCTVSTRSGSSSPCGATNRRRSRACAQVRCALELAPRRSLLVLHAGRSTASRTAFTAPLEAGRRPPRGRSRSAMIADEARATPGRPPTMRRLVRLRKVHRPAAGPPRSDRRPGACRAAGDDTGGRALLPRRLRPPTAQGGDGRGGAHDRRARRLPVVVLEPAWTIRPSS